MNDEQTKAQPPSQTIVNELTPLIRAPVHTTMRGLMTGFNGVPPHMILAMACFEAGYFVGQALGADIATVVQLRMMFKKSFDDGIQKSPMQALKSDWLPPAAKPQ